MTDTLLSVHEAQQRILMGFTRLPAERIPLQDGLGRVLAEDLFAAFDLPPFANSSMDGFAVRSAEVQSATLQQPIVLPISADIPAGGQMPQPLPMGSAARVMTGAPIPPGANAVVPVEDTDADFNSPALPQVRIFSPAPFGQAIRPQGQDVHAGQLLLTAGRILRPQDLALLAAQGVDPLTVIRRPRVALLSSGDELAQPGQPLQPGQVYDSNSPLLAALLSEAGAQVIRLGVAPDDPQQLYALLNAAMTASPAPDLIVTSGGVSVGAYDYLRQVIEAHGRITFWRVNMRPGKPLAFGNFAGVPVCGLPGNPVSAYVGCRVFILPILARLSGQLQVAQQEERATLQEAITSDGRESYLRGIVEWQDGKWLARLSGHQGSGNLAALVQANALLIVPSEVKSLPSGAEVKWWRL